MFNLYSKIITDSGAAGSVYMLARGLDCKGQGWVKINLNIASKTLGVQPRTIWNRCKLALKKGLFTKIEKKREIVYVKYTAIRKINSQIGGLVAKTKVSVNELKSLAELRSIAYQTAVIAQQARCYYSLEKQEKKVVSVSKTDEGFLNARRCNHFAKKSGSAFFKPNTNIATANLKTVGKQLGRSRSTISRNVKTLERIGVFIRQNKNSLPKGWEYDKRYHVYCTKKIKNSSIMVLKNGQKKLITSESTKSVVYRRMPNHYISERKQVTPLMVKDNSKEAFESKELKLWEKTKGYYKSIGFQKALSKLNLTQLKELAHTMMLYYKGQSIPLFNSWEETQLIEGIYTTIQSLENSEEQEVIMMELILRILNPANLLPLPEEIYKAIEPNFNENTKEALRETRLEKETAHKIANNSLYKVPTTQQSFKVEKRGRATYTDMSDYLLMNCKREQVRTIANYAQLIYADSERDLSSLDIHSLLDFIESLPDSKYLGKSKERVIKDMVKRIKKFKKPLASFYTSQLFSQKNFSKFS